MMRIDHAGNDKLAGHVDHPVSILRQFCCRTDGDNHPVTRKQRSVPDFGAGRPAGRTVLHRAEQVSMFQ